MLTYFSTKVAAVSLERKLNAILVCKKIRGWICTAYIRSVKTKRFATCTSLMTLIDRLEPTNQYIDNFSYKSKSSIYVILIFEKLIYIFGITEFIFEIQKPHDMISTQHTAAFDPGTVCSVRILMVCGQGNIVSSGDTNGERCCF